MRGRPLTAEQVEQRRRSAVENNLARHLVKGYHGPVEGGLAAGEGSPRRKSRKGTAATELPVRKHVKVRIKRSNNRARKDGSDPTISYTLQCVEFWVPT